MKTIICLLLIFTFAACSSNEKKNEALTVNNPATPLDTTVKELKFIEEVSISCSEDTDYNFNFGQGLFRNNVFLIDKDGNFFLFDDIKKQFHKFDKNGKFVKSFGGKGQGPGEFLDYTFFSMTPNNEIAVFDITNMRSSLFSTDGKFLKSNKATIFESSLFLLTSHTFQFSIDKNNNYYFVSDEEDNPNKKCDRYVKITDNTLNSVKDLLKFSYPILVNKTNKGFVSMSYIWPKFLLNNENIVIAKTDRYEFEIYDLNGNIFKKISREFDYKPLSFEDREDIEKKYGSTPKHEAAISDIQFLENNEIWVQNTREFQSYDIFNLEGKFIKKYKLPDTSFGFFKWTYDKKSSTLYCYNYTTDRETGFSSIKRYRVKNL